MKQYKINELLAAVPPSERAELKKAAFEAAVLEETISGDIRLIDGYPIIDHIMEGAPAPSLCGACARLHGWIDEPCNKYLSPVGAWTLYARQGGALDNFLHKRSKK